MLRLFAKKFCENKNAWKAAKFVDPTMAESFGHKFSEEEVEKILDPKGFLDKKEYGDYEGIDTIGKKAAVKKEENSSTTEKKKYGNPED